MRALLVDDEAMLRDIVCCLLEDLGFQVDQANSGDEAWQMIRSGMKPDLLLTDVRMPGQIDGIELAKRVKAMQEKTAILIMSGYVGSQNRTEEGLPFVLPKPFTMERLSQSINLAMSH